MLSILQILKKYHDDKKKGVEPAGGSAGSGDVPQTVVRRLEISTAAAGASSPESLSIYSVVNKELEEERAARAGEYHKKLVQWLGGVYCPGFQAPADFKEQCIALVEQAVVLLNTDSKEMIHACCTDYPADAQWLAFHAAGVMILSLEIARGMGYGKQQLNELGTSALVHDNGMLSCMDLVNKNARLDEGEMKRIREHPVLGAGALGTTGMAGLQGAAEVILQEHERFDGSGYPAGMKGEAIKEHAQIVGLADVYEAMTHNRPYRAKYSPPKAINMILNKKSLFSTRILKRLLERIGVFPAGSWVRLNTKETGVVLCVNQNLPLRPVVKVVFDENGVKLASPRQVDLAANLLICIEECLDDAAA
ncbi:MAG: HD domain-containing protein [Candidatus Omnitrophica bacterium]|nr:HD domain-containing protein [Candidatus Omnitrophota bacterium]